MLLWVLGVWGCARSPAEDVTAYTALVAQKAPDPGRDFSACRKIGDENLAGDCALVVAERGAMVRQQPPDTWCGQVPSGIWREECWFQAAEQERRGGRESVAAKLCVKAGPFQNDCAQHLWQTKVYRVIHGQPGQRPDFAGNMAAALAIYNEWEPYLTDTSDLETRFWEKFFQNGFEGAGEVNLAWCDDLSAADKTRCHAAARELVIREMAPNLDHNNAWTAFCAMAAPTSTDTATWFRWTPSPELDALVAERHAVLCNASASPPARPTPPAPAPPG